MGETRRGPVFKAGRDQTIAYAEHGNATVNANVVNSGGGAVDILAELRALRELLSRSPEQAASVALLEAAETEAKAAEPKRDRVVSLVEGATRLVAGANGFSAQAEQMIPRLQQIGAWAGRAWDTLGPTLGF